MLTSSRAGVFIGVKTLGSFGRPEQRVRRVRRGISVALHEVLVYYICHHHRRVLLWSLPDDDSGAPSIAEGILDCQKMLEKNGPHFPSIHSRLSTLPCCMQLGRGVWRAPLLCLSPPPLRRLLVHSGRKSLFLPSFFLRVVVAKVPITTTTTTKVCSASFWSQSLCEEGHRRRPK